jgi:hypothetical protein
MFTGHHARHERGGEAQGGLTIVLAMTGEEKRREAAGGEEKRELEASRRDLTTLLDMLFALLGGYLAAYLPPPLPPASSSSPKPGHVRLPAPFPAPQARASRLPSLLADPAVTDGHGYRGSPWLR